MFGYRPGRSAGRIEKEAQPSYNPRRIDRETERNKTLHPRFNVETDVTLCLVFLPHTLGAKTLNSVVFGIMLMVLVGGVHRHRLGSADRAGIF